MNAESECTIRSLLPDELQDADEALARHLRAQQEGADANVPGFVLNLMRDRAIEAARDSLDVDLFSTLARGWSGALELREIGIESRRKPEQEKTVFFGRHSLVAAVYPIVEVHWMRSRTFALKFTLELKAEFKFAGISVKNGHIVAVGASECDVETRLLFGKSPLHPKVKTPPRHLTNAHTLVQPGWRIPE